MKYLITIIILLVPITIWAHNLPNTPHLHLPDIPAHMDVVFNGPIFKYGEEFYENGKLKPCLNQLGKPTKCSSKED